MRTRRLYGLLARRGFEHDTIDQAMQTLRDEIDADTPDHTDSAGMDWSE